MSCYRVRRGSSSRGKSLVSMISRGSNPSEASDPDVRMAYRSICQGGTLNWLALTYEKWSSGLRLSAAGSQGLSELRQSIANSEHSVIFAFCRLSVDGIDCFATITYIPESTSGLRRARTSMAARTVQSWFKRPQATLTISRVEDLTLSAILDAMPTPPTSFIPSTTMVRSHSEVQGREKALPDAPRPVIRTASEPATYVSLRGPPNFGNPHARSVQREAARLAAEEEAEAVQREEAVRQARIKEQRAAEAKQAEEEELARRAQLERDLARKAAARVAREEAEREEEERCVREREERRRRSAERRAEETRRVEEWMREEERKREEFARAEEELKKNAIERREAARVAAAKRRRESRLDSDSVLLSGWVTVQHPESVAWRRRYFQLTDALLRLYHRQTDVDGVPSDAIVLKNTGPTIKEWYEGFEELRSIPHAFALVFANDQSMMLFSDSAPEKDLLSGLLMTCP